MSLSRLFFFLVSFFIGTAAGELWVWPVWAAAVIAAAAAISLNVRRLRMVSVILLGLGLGIFRIQAVLHANLNDIVYAIGQTLTLAGDIRQPSTIDGTAQRFELTALQAGQRRWIGKVVVAAPAVPAVRAGSRVQLTCGLTALTSTSQRRYWSHGVHARCATVQVHLLVDRVPGWRTMLGRWQERLLVYVRGRFNEPQASLLNGILIGNTNGMPDRLNRAFQATGTTHIVALSGFNVTIIMAAVVTWLVRVVGRRWAWVPALVLLVSFVIMSGASASVVRAAIMAVIVQAGLFVGRPIAIGRLLAYTAVIMTWENPLLVFHDLGFQLSFLATIGLVALSMPMQQRLIAVPERFGLRESMATTLSAIVMTEPLLVWRFARLSLVAPVVNVVVLPLIPLAMAMGALCLLGMWIPPVATVFVPVTDAVLRLIIWCISAGAALPQAVIGLGSISAVVCGTLFSFVAIRLLLCYDQTPYPPRL